MEFWKLFVVALMPVLKVLLITALGTFLALNRFDILNSETARKNLNTVSETPFSLILYHNYIFVFFGTGVVCSRPLATSIVQLVQ
jgi:hypothetical protein